MSEDIKQSYLYCTELKGKVLNVLKQPLENKLKRFRYGGHVVLDSNQSPELRQVH